MRRKWYEICHLQTCRSHYIQKQGVGWSIPYRSIHKLTLSLQETLVTKHDTTVYCHAMKQWLTLMLQYSCICIVCSICSSVLYVLFVQYVPPCLSLQYVLFVSRYSMFELTLVCFIVLEIVSSSPLNYTYYSLLVMLFE